VAQKEALSMRLAITQNRDGFHVRETDFALPADTWELDQQTKRAVTICNLFVNHQYTISDIARVLDEDRGAVIGALLAEGIIRDRRTTVMAPPDGVERRKAAANSRS
jgi:hypothetical protein